MRYLQVKDDVYFIGERLKEIDENYIILYNLEKNAYEVWLSEFEEGTFSLEKAPSLEGRNVVAVLAPAASK